MKSTYNPGFEEPHVELKVATQISRGCGPRGQELKKGIYDGDLRSGVTAHTFVFLFLHLAQTLEECRPEAAS
jgi:hypothetical protein